MRQIQKGTNEYRELVSIMGSESAADAFISGKVLQSQDIKAAGVAYKAQRPTPSLSELVQMQKRLHNRIKALGKAQKDDAEAQLARQLVELLSLTRGMGLLDDDVLNLVAETSLAEVLSVILSLNGMKASKGYYISPFFGTVKSVDIADVRQIIGQQQAEKNMQTNPYEAFFN